jgi:hypothetical protein
MIATTTTLDALSMHFDPVGSWGLVALVTAALAAILVAVPPDRSRAPGRRFTTLMALRIAAFLALVTCLLRPTLVSARKARQQRVVVVLADASESMTVADGPDGRCRWDVVRQGLAAARPAARALTQDGDVEIAAWRLDRELRALPATDEDPFPLGDWEPGPGSGETALGAALEESVRAAAGRVVAGVVVLSDGAQNAHAPRDLPPQVAARRLGEAGVPVWSVTVGEHRGGDQVRDAAVVNLSVAETVYLGNMLEVAGRIRLEGLAGGEVAVTLLAEDDEGGLQPVASTRVRATEATVEEPIRLAWTPRVLGERKLTLRVEPQEGEVVLVNNELSTFVNVIEGGLRVLYLEGALRVEQRFLRRVLAASPDMQVDFQWIDSGRRDRWPIDLGPKLSGDYRVFLIGDLDASALRPEDLQAIATKVRGGAGIGLLGGFHAFEAGGWGSSPLGPALPFEPDRLARQPFDAPVREALHLPGPLKMVPDPRFGGISILRLGDDGVGGSRAAWEALPPLEGANDLGRLKPTAKPLATTVDGHPLLVAQEYGAGRVIAFAADSTWRWAMQGADAAHRRFWRQFVLWLARQDDVEGDDLWVRLAQRRISAGTALPFDAGVMSSADGLAADVAIESVVIAPSGQQRPVRVVRQGASFTGTVAECVEPGDWRLVVRAVGSTVAGPLERTARFTVYRQDMELANPRANPLLMRQLAELTGGDVVPPEELSELFRAIAARPVELQTLEERSYSPWDTWPMLALLAGCLCGEWFLRKRWGLV